MKSLSSASPPDLWHSRQVCAPTLGQTSLAKKSSTLAAHPAPLYMGLSSPHARLARTAQTARMNTNLGAFNDMTSTLDDTTGVVSVAPPSESQKEKKRPRERPFLSRFALLVY